MRFKLYKLIKAYKNLCEKLKQRYDQQLIKKLETLYTKDLNNFWRLLKKLKTDRKLTSNNEDLTSSDELQSDYIQLLQKQADCNLFNIHKIKPRNKLNLDQLNKPLRLEEIKQGIKRLKKKKAPVMLGSHRDDDIHRLERRNLVASDSSPKVHRQSIHTTCAHSVLNRSSSTNRFY